MQQYNKDIGVISKLSSSASLNKSVQIFTLWGVTSPLRSDIKNLFHSELPIYIFYPLLLEFWENIKKWVVKTISHAHFWCKLWFSAKAPKRPPQNTKMNLPTTLVDLERNLRISGLCIFHAESNGGVHCDRFCGYVYLFRITHNSKNIDTNFWVFLGS